LILGLYLVALRTNLRCSGRSLVLGAVDKTAEAPDSVGMSLLSGDGAVFVASCAGVYFISLAPGSDVLKT
jgi:hypothetical protein